MKATCIPIEELGRVAALPQDAPERAHLETCARCRSLLAMLAEFESPTVSRQGARFADADAQLRATIAGLAGGDPDSVSEPEPRESRVRARAPWFGWRLPSWPRRRLAFAFASLVVVALAGTSLYRTLAHDPQMRAASPGTPQATPFVAAAARQVAGGAELSWSAERGADRYRVVFFDASLNEVARLDAGAATTLLLRADALPAGLSHGQSVGWQVEALAGDDLRARTPTRPLLVP